MENKPPLTNVFNDISNLHHHTIMLIVSVTVLWILFRHINSSNKQEECRYNTELGHETYHKLQEHKTLIAEVNQHLVKAYDEIRESAIKQKTLKNEIEDMSDRFYYD